ncbi:ADP-ribose glycohydrolase OARD1-like [Littorina saxatilis]|uniref:ADP-ribose glycohydrolase OARD1-like n=1 Tax=Littorina saxatilis TaxID=31220 RepID=UPI0038B5FFD2
MSVLRNLWTEEQVEKLYHANLLKLYRDRQWRQGQPVVGFELTEIRGDLFSCEPDDAMAHCVSEDLEMGKGIAVYFKQSFGKVDQLRAQNKKVGEVAVLRVGASYVYYMITKKRYFHKPSYKTLRSSMEAMRDHCKQNNVASLAMPQIGCGLDELNWSAVLEIIKEVFKNTGITVKIYTFGG